MTTWTRSSFCGSGACLEAMCTGPVVLVQGSTTPGHAGGPVQAWSHDEWRGLLAAIRGNQPHPAAMPIGDGWVQLRVLSPVGRHEPLTFDREEWSAFCDGVISGEFDPEKLSSPAPEVSGGWLGGGATGSVPVKPGSTSQGKDGHDPITAGEPYLPGRTQPAATGAGGDCPAPVVPAPVAVQPRYVLDRDAVLDLVQRYGYACSAGLGDVVDELLDAIRGALTPIPAAEPDPFNAEESPTPAAAPELLRRGVITARAYLDYPFAVASMTEGLERTIPSGRMAEVLALALLELSKPARIGDLEQVAAGLAEAVFDAAHEGCDDETGCSGGGLPFWREYVDNVLMPVVREHAAPSGAVPADDANEWAKAIAPLVEHNPETRPQTEPGGNVAAESGCSAATAGEADPVTRAPGAGSAEPCCKPAAISGGNYHAFECVFRGRS